MAGTRQTSGGQATEASDTSGARPVLWRVACSVLAITALFSALGSQQVARAASSTATVSQSLSGTGAQPTPASVGLASASRPTTPSVGKATLTGSGGSGSTGSEDPGSVSCVSTAFCAAVGSYVTPQGPTDTLIQMWDGTRWRIVSSPNVSSQRNQLSAVSCSSSSLCAAVGFYTANNQASQTLVEQWNGASWTVVSSPDTSATDDDVLVSVSCPTSTFCSAAGTQDKGSGTVIQTLIENWTSGQWQIVTTPNAGSQQDNFLKGVSCSTPSFCAATGSTTANNGTLVLMWNGATWSLTSSPNTGTAPLLNAVSCLTSSFCVAVGDFQTTSSPFPDQTLVEAWSGAMWSIVSSPNVGSQDNQLKSVSCVSTSSCFAVGYYQAGNPYPYETLTELWNGTTWTTVSSPSPGSVENILEGVSCTATNFCFGVGDIVASISPPLDYSLFEQWNGTAWTLLSGTTVPELPGQGGVPGTNENPAGANPGEPGLCPAQGSGADPCNTESGAFYETFNDLSIPGRGATLSFTHTYSTVAASSAGPLGFGWTDSYNASLALSGSSPNEVATISQENGSQVAFTQPTSGSAWPAQAPRVIATLKHNADGSWTYTRQARLVFGFNSSGLLVSQTDLNGYTTSLAYTGGQLTSITDPAGRSLQVVWTGSHITSVTDTAVTPNRTVTFQYNDGAGNLTDVIDVNGGHTQLVYDTHHRMTNVYDPNCYAAKATCNSGNGVVNAYSSAGQVTSQQDQLGRTTVFAYAGDPTSAAGGTTTITNPKQNVTVDSYQFGVRTSETRGSGTAQAATTYFRYDPATLAMTATEDPNGHVTQNTVDASGNVTGTQDALGRTTSTTYNALNEPLTKTDGNQVATTYTYDASGNLKTVSTPLVGTTKTQVTTYTYGDSAHPGDVTAMQNPDGNTWNYTYDTHGDKTTVKDPLQGVSTTCYNADGWKLASYTPRAGSITCTVPPPASAYETTYSYAQSNGQTDEFGDVQSVSGPVGQTKTAYDSDRNVVSNTDADNKQTQYRFDLANEQTDVIRADQTDLHTDYFPDGTVQDQKQGSNVLNAYLYDALARATSDTDALLNATIYTYDGAGNRLMQQDPGGSCTVPQIGCTTTAYDADNEVTSVTYSDGVTANVSSIAYDNDGQRTSMTDGTGMSTWTYDSLHRLTSYTNGAGALVGYDYFTPQGNFDLMNQVGHITYPNGAGVVTRSFDADGRLGSVRDWTGSTVTSHYDADGNLQTSNFPGSVTDQAAYDNADRMQSITSQGTGGTVFAATYTRDPNGQVTSDNSANAPIDAYGYTPLNQLCYAGSSSTTPCSSPPSGSETYGYDSFENPTTFSTATSGTVATSTQSFNAADELCWSLQASSGNGCSSPPSGATNFGYDTRGNRAQTTPPTGSATCYTYDQADRVTAVHAGTGTGCTTGQTAVVGYTYDGTGLRMSKTVSSIATQFAWDETGSLPLLLQEVIGGVATDYVYGPSGLPLERLSTPAGSTGRSVWNATSTAATNGSPYQLQNNNGSAWVQMDNSKLSFTVIPTVNSTAVLSANADLYTSVSFVNQDLGITVNGGAPVVWKESGGYSAFKPAAVFAQTTVAMSAGTRYTVSLSWKTNVAQPAGSFIQAGAGPSAPFSPTILSAVLTPTSAPLVWSGTSSSGTQYTTSSRTWTLVDPTQNSALNPTFTPTTSGQALLTANADIFTASSGTNQDVGICVAAAASLHTDCSNGTVVAWAENSGASVYMPIAALVEADVMLTANTQYSVGIVWRANGSGTIYAGAGTNPYSQSSLVVQLSPPSANNVNDVSYTGPPQLTRSESSSDSGTGWADISSSNLQYTFTPGLDGVAYLGGNGSLFSNSTSFNIDLGICVAAGGGQCVNVGWKESGSASAYSPDAAFLQIPYPVTAGVAYTVKLQWRTNIAMPGGTALYAGAGSNPYSPTTLSVLLAPSLATSALYYHHDQLGSTRALTDASGAVQASYQYDPYGNVVHTSGTVANPLRYAGQYQDQETGLFYLRARYFDPTTGQFLSRDPLTMASGSGKAVASSASGALGGSGTTLQAYGYANDNPLNVTDSSGECGLWGSDTCWSDIGNFFGNVGGGIATAWNDTTTYVKTNAGSLALIALGTAAVVGGSVLTFGLVDAIVAAGAGVVAEEGAAVGGLEVVDLGLHAPFVLAPGITVTIIGGAMIGYGAACLK